MGTAHARRLRFCARLSLVCGLGLASSACHERSLESEPERAPLTQPRPAGSPSAADDRQRRFVDALSKYPPASPEHTAFIRAQLEDARFSATAAMHAWASGDAVLANDAYGFLQNIEDLALVPAIEQPLPAAPKAASQGLWLLSDAETSLRRKVLLRINALLDDTRELPAEPNQAGSSHRVCDEAYATLRRLVFFPDPDLKAPFVPKLFFASSTATRSSLIQRVRRTPTWMRVLDPDSDIEDQASKPHSSPRARPRLAPMH